MGRDKADLVVADGLSLRTRGLQLLQAQTSAAYLSIAADDERAYENPVLRDARPDFGPLAGLEAAFRHAPEAAWLVLACDLPLLTPDVLHHLISYRDPAADATCFTSRFDGKPEPLCAIYEPAAAATLETALDNDQRCARRFLASLERKELALPEPSALDNCNRPEDLEEVRQRLAGEGTLKTIVVEFCGPLREEAGARAEEIRTRAATAAGLWEELRMARDFSLGIDAVRIAINDEFQPWTTALRDRDRLALFPPFAGG
jgi:molybdopterin-guanine dinucleotide biosynthesis protein A